MLVREVLLVEDALIGCRHAFQRYDLHPALYGVQLEPWEGAGDMQVPCCGIPFFVAVSERLYTYRQSAVKKGDPYA
jgi:hypothetical protein